MLEQDTQLAVRRPGAGSVTPFGQGPTVTFPHDATAPHGGSYARDLAERLNAIPDEEIVEG